MERYILRYRGSGPKPDCDVLRVEQEPETKILEETPRMLLVEGSKERIDDLVAGLPDWVASAEQTYALPDPRPRVEKTASSVAASARRGRAKRSSPG